MVLCPGGSLMAIRTVRHQSILPREVQQSPALDVFKTWQDKALSNLVSSHSEAYSMGVGLGTSWDSFQTESSWDFVIKPGVLLVKHAVEIPLLWRWLCDSDLKECSSTQAMFSSCVAQQKQCSVIPVLSLLRIHPFLPMYSLRAEIFHMFWRTFVRLVCVFLVYIGMLLKRGTLL